MPEEYEVKKGDGSTYRTTDTSEARAEKDRGNQVKERHGGSWFDSDP